jgi:hypothetical protein
VEGGGKGVIITATAGSPSFCRCKPSACGRGGWGWESGCCFHDNGCVPNNSRMQQPRTHMDNGHIVPEVCMRAPINSGFTTPRRYEGINCHYAHTHTHTHTHIHTHTHTHTHIAVCASSLAVLPASSDTHTGTHTQTNSRRLALRPSTPCSTLVWSRQSMQLTRITPRCLHAMPCIGWGVEGNVGVQ